MKDILKTAKSLVVRTVAAAHHNTWREGMLGIALCIAIPCAMNGAGRQAAPTSGQETWGQPVQGLEVSIRFEDGSTATNRVLDADNPIPIRWTIRNVSAEEKAILLSDENYCPVLFDVVDADGKVHPNRIDYRWLFMHRLPAPPQRLVLKPGDVKEGTFDLSRFIESLRGRLTVVGLYAPQASPVIPKEYLESPKFADAVMSRIASKPLSLTVYRHSDGPKFELNKDIATQAALWQESQPPNQPEPKKLVAAESIRFEEREGKLMAKLKFGYATEPKARYLTHVELYNTDGKVLASKDVSFETPELLLLRPALVWDEYTLELEFALPQGDLEKVSAFRLALSRAEEEAWGETNSGLQARLRADKTIWAPGQTPSFQAEIRNQGSDKWYNLARSFCELKLDGARYVRSPPASVKSSPLPLSRDYISFPVSLSERWVKLESTPADRQGVTSGKLVLTPGQHNLRIHIFCDGGSAHPNLPVRSNPVDFEVQPGVPGLLLNDLTHGKGRPVRVETSWAVVEQIYSTTPGFVTMTNGHAVFTGYSREITTEGVTLVSSADLLHEKIEDIPAAKKVRIPRAAVVRMDEGVAIVKPGTGSEMEARSTNAPHALVVTPEQIARIERLIRNAPVTTSQPTNLVELTPGSQSEYRLRADVVVATICAAGRSNQVSFPIGQALYLPSSNVFYLQWDGIGASSLHYYGPFSGEPQKILLSASSDPAPASHSRVNGRVLDKPGGHGASGVKVRLFSDQKIPRETVTDSQGNYVFNEVAYIGREHDVHVGEHGPGVWTDDVRVFVPDSKRGAVTNVTAPDLYVSTPCTINGIVKDAVTGKGVPNVEITLSTMDRNRSSITTDQVGAFRLHVIPREVQIDCNGTEERYLEPDSEPTMKVTLSADDPVKAVEFKVRSAPAFTGQVLLPNGEPAVDMPVLVQVGWSHSTVNEGKRLEAARARRDERVRAGLEPPSVAKSVGLRGINRHDANGVGRDFRMRTDQNGRFQGYLRLPEGTRSDADYAISIVVVARSDDKSLAALEIAETTTIDPPPAPIKATLEKTSTAEFEIVNPAGHAVVDARLNTTSWLFDYIYIPDSIKEVAPEFVNLGGGRYRASGLVPRWDYGIRAEAEGYKCRKELRIIAQPGQTLPLKKLALDWWGEKAVPGLISKFKSADQYDREGACHELSSLGPRAKEAVTELVALLNKDKQYTVRFAAAEALGKIGPAASNAVPDLIRAMKEDKQGVPRDAATALGRIGSAEAVPALIAGLTNEDTELQYVSAEALGLLGPTASSAVPALIAALSKESDWHLVTAAAIALGKIGSVEALPALRQVAQHKVGQVRMAADDAIAAIELAHPATATGASAKPVEAQPAWGKPIAGVAVQLGPDKLAILDPEKASLVMTVRNLGQRDLSLIQHFDPLPWFLDVDGMWYVRQLSGNGQNGSIPLKVGHYESMSFELAAGTNDSWLISHEMGGKVPRRPSHEYGGKSSLYLSPGRHTIRVAWDLQSYSAEGEPLTAYSNPVELEILQASGSTLSFLFYGCYNLVSVNGEPLPASVSLGGATHQVLAGSFNIHADGTCSRVMNFPPPKTLAWEGQELSATYTRDGSKLTVQWQDKGAGKTVGFIDRNTLTMENEGMVLVYRLADWLPQNGGILSK